MSARSMRVAGVVVAGLAGVVIALSVGTDHGLAGGEASVAGTTIAGSGGSLTVDAFVAFALAHPAYPVAVLVGLVLFALGDDVPLLGD
jgi:hypothetical protein